MAFSSGIYLINRAVARFKSSMRERVAAALIVLGGVVLLACALGFGLASAYMALAREMPDFQAALWVTGGLVILGAAAIAVAVMRRPKAATQSVPARPIDAADPLEQITDTVLRDATDWVSREPVSAMSTVLLLGLVVGLLRQNGNS